jgi:phytoene desaturase
MADEIRTVSGPADAAAFERFCTWLTELYRIEMRGFVDRNYDSPLDLVRPLGPALALLRSGALGRLGPAVSRRFSDERLRRLFSFQALYAGLPPQQALAVYAVITYMDVVAGVSFPEGGMHAIPAALAAAAEKAGAQLRFGAPVARIELERDDGGPVRGVRLRSGELVAADAVVCNLDLGPAYRNLLPGLRAPRAVRRGHYSPSAVVWHAGVRGAPPAEAAHHNIHFGDAWGQAFRALFRDGRRMPDPSLLVTVPTVSDPALAPPGRMLLSVLEPVPNLDGRVDWSAERRRLGDELAARADALGYPTDAEVEALYDPRDWARLGMERGTPFALSHRFLQSGPFRPNNVDPRAPGLFFTGSTTVPGVGVPMVLLSGRLAAERVARAVAA